VNDVLIYSHVCPPRPVKALACRAFGPIADLELVELPVPEPAAGQVRVSLRAAALNFMDTLIIQGRYQLKPPLPFLPGAEMAGIVSAVGTGSGLPRVGDAVIVRRSYDCLAEEVVADLDQVLTIPEPRDWAAVAALSVAYSTADEALVRRGAVRPDETVLVLGAAGGVGTAAVQIARALGARVIAACRGAERAAVCLANGAHVAVDYSSGDLREQLRAAAGAGGVQVVVDTVGGDHAEPALRSLGKEGRYLVVGFAAGAIPRIPANLLLLKGASAIGVNADTSRDDPQAYRATMDRLLAWLAEGTIRPVISATFPLARAAEALQRLADRALYGKVVIVP